jgi:hypothetical protein
MNPALVEEIYVIPEYDSVADVLKNILKETDPTRILLLSNYTLSFGFFTQPKGASTFVYRSDSSSSVEDFVSSVYLIFKESAPKELVKPTRSTSLVKSTSFISRYLRAKNLLPISGDIVVDVSFNFETEEIIVG